MSIVKKYKGYDVPEGVIRELAGQFYKIDAGILVHQGCNADSDDWEESGYETLKYLDAKTSAVVIELPQEPEQYMPKVGEECEYNVKIELEKPDFRVVTVISIIEGYIYFYFNDRDVTSSGGREVFSTIKCIDDFRPIKTEREKFIDAGLDSFHGFSAKEASIILGTLYDNGARFNDHK